MLSKDQILSYLKEYKDKNRKKFYINKIGIFGSFARGEQSKDSDLDIVVDMNKPNLISLSSIMLDIKEHFKSEVDIVALWDKMNPRLKKRIDKEAIYV